MFTVDDFLAVDDLLMAELPVRQHVMRGLAALVDESFGDDAASLAEELRSRGGIHTLVHLLDDESSKVYHRAMMVLGNKGWVAHAWRGTSTPPLPHLCPTSTSAPPLPPHAAARLGSPRPKALLLSST